MAVSPLPPAISRLLLWPRHFRRPPYHLLPSWAFTGRLRNRCWKAIPCQQSYQLSQLCNSGGLPEHVWAAFWAVGKTLQFSCSKDPINSNTSVTPHRERRVAEGTVVFFWDCKFCFQTVAWNCQGEGSHFPIRLHW